VIGLQTPTAPLVSVRTRNPFVTGGRYAAIPLWFSSRSQGAITLVPLMRYPNLPSFTIAPEMVEIRAAVITVGR